MKTLRHVGVVFSNLFEDFPVTENCNTHWYDYKQTKDDDVMNFSAHFTKMIV